MTTIAYKDGVIAYDSRATNSGVVKSDTFDKCYVKNECKFFFAGTIGDIIAFADAYLANHREAHKSIDIVAFVWDGSTLYRAGNDDGILWREPAVHDCDAIGSGGHMALIAMDMGASAEEAIRMVAKRDTFTGGQIRTFEM